MKRKSTIKGTLFCFLLLQPLLAQTSLKIGSNTNTINASAVIEIESTSAGLLLPRMSLAQRNAIASPVAGLLVWCTDCGTNGEIHLYNGASWINFVSAVPDAPSNVVATASNGQASISYLAPLVDGGSPITSYTVTSSAGGFTASGTSSPIVVSGLARGTNYQFSVVATNAIGNSKAGTSAAVTTFDVPGAPSNVVASTANGQMSLAFSAPVSNGGSPITDYTVTSSPGGSIASGTSSPIVFTNLIGGTAYQFTVLATNALGNSVSGGPSLAVTYLTRPDAPANVKFLAISDTQALVYFTAPSNGGSPITKYIITRDPNYTIAEGTSSPITVNINLNVINIKLYAVNAVGASDPVLSKNNLTAACGAYVAAGVWKHFMCHNLGGDTALDPHIPVQDIHGNYYQWGIKDPVASAYSTSGGIAGWNTTGAPDGAWSDVSKTDKDPCPIHYRLPTSSEMSYLANGPNIPSITGSWLNDGNFTTAMHIGVSTMIARTPPYDGYYEVVSKTLTFPAAGERFSIDGSLRSRGGNGYYWTSSSNSTGSAVSFSVGYLYVNNYFNRVNGFVDNRFGLSVRCVIQ